MSDKLRVTILGTSNSAMKDGYTNALRDHPRIEIHQNLSIGASHPPLVPYRLAGHSLDDSDILLVDLVVNQQRALVQSKYGDEALKTACDILDYIVAICSASKTMPVVLLMPELFGYNSDRRQQMRLHSIQECERRGIAYYDGYKIAELISKQSGISFEELFKDRSHIKSKHAYRIGRDLAKSLLEWRRKVTHNTEVGAYAPFSCVEFPKDEKRSVIRETSIARIHLIRMEPKDTIKVDAPPNSEIVGIAFNMAQSNCDLRIEGAASLTKSLVSAQFLPTHELWLVIWSLMAPIPVGENGLVQLTACARGKSAAVELHDYGRLKPEFRNEPQRIEIAGLIFRHAAVTQDMMRVVGSVCIGPKDRTIPASLQAIAT